MDPLESDETVAGDLVLFFITDLGGDFLIVGIIDLDFLSAAWGLLK